MHVAITLFLVLQQNALHLRTYVYVKVATYVRTYVYYTVQNFDD